jgi:hypothetical protein
LKALSTFAPMHESVSDGHHTHEFCAAAGAGYATVR